MIFQLNDSESKQVQWIVFFILIAGLVLAASYLFGASNDPRYEQIEVAATIEVVREIIYAGDNENDEDLMVFARERIEKISYEMASKMVEEDPQDYETWDVIHRLLPENSQKPEIRNLKEFAIAKFMELRSLKASELAKTASTLAEWNRVGKLAIYDSVPYKESAQWLGDYWHEKAREWANLAETAKDWRRVNRHAKDNTDLKKFSKFKLFQVQAQELADINFDDFNLLEKSHTEGVTDEELKMMPEVDSYVIHAFFMIAREVLGIERL